MPRETAGPVNEMGDGARCLHGGRSNSDVTAVQVAHLRLPDRGECESLARGGGVFRECQKCTACVQGVSVVLRVLSGSCSSVQGVFNAPRECSGCMWVGDVAWRIAI